MTSYLRTYDIMHMTSYPISYLYDQRGANQGTGPSLHESQCCQAAPRRGKERTNKEMKLSSRVEPFAASNAATATTTATGRIGRVCDSITRRSAGIMIGSLKCGRAAEQWRRFQQGSTSGDAGGPSALDALPSLEHSTDRGDDILFSSWKVPGTYDLNHLI